MKYKAPRLVAVVTCALLSGCAGTYYQEGTQGLPNADVAEIFTDSPAGDGFIIEKVDGVKRSVGLFDRYMLVPGERCLTVAYSSVVSTGSGHPEVCFIAEKGQVYSIGVLRSEKNWSIVVYDTQTKVIVPNTRFTLD